MPTTPSELLDAARAWIEGDPDAETRAELEALVARDDRTALGERLASPLAFGTAGLRGAVGAGSARMNRATVIRATRGLADYLAARGDGARALPVVVGHDARTTSPAFARDVVAVLIGARIPVRWFEEPVPTPLVAFAARELGATAAVVVTASHNPREDNGYKVYLDDAVQLAPPHDRAVEAAIARVGRANAVPRTSPEENARVPLSARVDAAPLDQEAFFQRYLAEVSAELGASSETKTLRIVYTPLHGVGFAFARRALALAGFTDVRVVPEQAQPDGAFPTVRFPNPEEPGTLDLALALARDVDADLVLANDPDADRLAAAVPTASGRWLPLRGNQLAVLLADAMLERVREPGRAAMFTSIVTTPLVEAVARERGVHCERTLTGFKWLFTAAVALEKRGQRFVYGCEEALGYAVTRAVRDKDGISAAMALALLAERCRREGRSLLERLHAIERRLGVWASVQHSVRVAGPAALEEVARALARVDASPPASLGGMKVVAVRDYRRGAETRPRWLGSTPLVELELEGGRVLVRPSGTEPKLKIYVDLRGETAPSASVFEMEETLAKRAGAVAREVVEMLGISGEDGGS
ncbi:MAG TPA: phospho-sugar mutase [Polyangiaceae bacterium]